MTQANHPRHYPGLFEALAKKVMVPGKKKVLDLGSGDFQWKLPGYEMHYADKKPNGSANYSEVDLDRMPYPFKDGEFDQVVAIELIEHLERPFEFFAECSRVLKRGGHLILTTPNVESRHSREMFFRQGHLAYFDPPALEPEDGHRTPVFKFELERWLDNHDYFAWRFMTYGPSRDILILRAVR